MSGLVAGAKKLLGRGASLDTRLVGLEQAVAGARGRLDDSVVDQAALVVDRAGARLRLSAEHTVVALAGATGSGKSSTFNALAGLDLAAVGVRRPTTSYATACVWGEDPAAGLLDWLEIPPRHRVVRDSTLDQRPPAQGARRAGAARPARPRLHRGRAPPRGGATGRAHRPDGVGARPAEVRRPGRPPAVPRAPRQPPRGDAGRAQPRRRGREGGPRADARATSAACSSRTGSATYPCSPPRPAPARASTSCAASSASASPTRRRPGPVSPATSRTPRPGWPPRTGTPSHASSPARTGASWWTRSRTPPGCRSSSTPSSAPPPSALVVPPAGR